jgi:putative transposase
MFTWLKLILSSALRLLWSRRDLQVENLVLRHQLAVLKRRRRRPGLGTSDKLFWVCVRRFWGGWKEALAIVTPDTVVRWHRAGFGLYWRWVSRHRAHAGRKPTRRELRELIFRMVAENPTWGAPRIHGELKMLSFDVVLPSVGWEAPIQLQNATKPAAQHFGEGQVCYFVLAATLTV